MYNPEQEELLKEYKSQFPSGYNRYDPTTGDIIVDQNTGNPITYPAFKLSTTPGAPILVIS